MAPGRGVVLNHLSALQSAVARQELSDATLPHVRAAVCFSIGTTLCRKKGGVGMKKLLLSKIVFATAAAATATVAFAQSPWVPGSEIYGQTMQVQTNGVVNSITFNSDGTAQIMTPGGTTVPA